MVRELCQAAPDRETEADSQAIKKKAIVIPVPASALPHGSFGERWAATGNTEEVGRGRLVFQPPLPPAFSWKWYFVGYRHES